VVALAAFPHRPLPLLEHLLLLPILPALLLGKLSHASSSHIGATSHDVVDSDAVSVSQPSSSHMGAVSHDVADSKVVVEPQDEVGPSHDKADSDVVAAPHDVGDPVSMGGGGGGGDE